jgi:hypothetical protein
VSGDENEILEEIDLRVQSAYYTCDYWEDNDLCDILYYLRKRMSCKSLANNISVETFLKQTILLYLSLLNERRFMDEALRVEIEAYNNVGLFSLLTNRLLSGLSTEKLQPVTFVIPLRIDSLERAQNLDAVIETLQTFEHAKILILEADKRPVYKLKRDYPNVHVEFIQDANSVFHRTKYLNNLLRKANTNIVGIWDSDVVLSAWQIKDALYAVQTKKAVMSFPYNGQACYLSAEESSSFRLNLLSGYNSIQCFVQSIPSFQHAMGGAFFVNKEEYLKAGGENEHFYGWGAEDVERVQRMHILGLPVYRTKGRVYHLYHPVNENSCYNNKELELKSKEELIKVSEMGKEELTEYVKSWEKGEDTISNEIQKLQSAIDSLKAENAKLKKENYKFSNWWSKLQNEELHLEDSPIYNALMNKSTEPLTKNEVDNWIQYIDILFPDFKSIIKAKYSQISYEDLRLCYLIKMPVHKILIAEYLCIEKQTVSMRLKRLAIKMIGKEANIEDLKDFLNFVN